MKNRGLMVNTAIVSLLAIILFIVGLSYSSNKVGNYILLPDGTESREPDYAYEVLQSLTEVDAYGLRFTDALYYKSINQVFIILISSQSIEETRNIRAYDFDTNLEKTLKRTGLNAQLYHSFENLYCMIEEGYTGTLIIEVSDENNQILERVRYRVN